MLKYIKYKTKYLNLKGGSKDMSIFDNLIYKIQIYENTDKDINQIKHIIETNKELLNKTDCFGNTPLHEAIYYF